MKEFKGTKGKWLIRDTFREPSILNESGQVIFTHNQNCFDKETDADGGKMHSYYSHNKMMANAKLIAAALPMLEALQGLLNIINNSDGVSGYHLNDEVAQWGEFFEVDNAIAAINKALD